MQMMELTKKQTKKYERRKNIEEIKRKWTILKSKILGQKLDKNDSRTIQAQPDVNGEVRDYYIKNQYLQKGEAYTAVFPITEDFENGKFVYRGIVQNADNAIGILESNVPISEIVSDVKGNLLFQDILSIENSTKARDEYYQKIGESTEKLENHHTHFGNPDFVLGRIEKNEKGIYSYNQEVSTDIEEMLNEEREEDKKQDSMREKDSVIANLGKGIVVAEEDCWMEREEGIQFAGINRDALYYQFTPQKIISTESNQFVYIGTLKIGKTVHQNKKDGEPIKFNKPYTYTDMVIWTEGKNMIQYFLEKKFAGLKTVLGDIFTNDNVKQSKNNSQNAYLGGITVDEDGICQKNEKVPSQVEVATKQYMDNRETIKKDNIIDFYRR